METKYKTIPFDVNRINEEGVQIVTRDGRNARVICTNCHGTDGKTLLALANNTSYEFVVLLYENGRFNRNKEDSYDLFMRVPCKYRKMTKQELSWWLRDCPEEHREWKFDYIDNIYCIRDYDECEANDECDETILIRRNGGEWKEPLIED